MILEGRSLVIKILAIACIYGVLSGAKLVSDARTFLRANQLAKQQIEQGKSDSADLSFGEVLIVSTIVMAEKLKPGAIKQSELEANNQVIRSYLVLGTSLMASCILILYCLKSKPGRSSRSRRNS